MLEFIINYYVQILLTLSVTLVSRYFRHIKKTFNTILEDNKLIKANVLSISRLHIIQNGEILLCKDKISQDELQDFTDLYIPYQAMGGNGTGKTMYHAIQTKYISDLRD